MLISSWYCWYWLVYIHHVQLIWLFAPYSSFMFSSCDVHLGRRLLILANINISSSQGGACFVTIHKQHVSLGVYNQMFPVEPWLNSTSTNLTFWCCDSRSDQGLFILHVEQFESISLHVPDMCITCHRPTKIPLPKIPLPKKKRRRQKLSISHGCV